ncbi:MAG TPA: type 1 glutamine amidotransferase domain-containing protein [Gemmatimonadales bacterium]|jgi:protease I
MTLPLDGKRIAVLIAEGVEDLEFHVPYMRLQEEGADVVGAAVTPDTVRGKHGLEIRPDVTVDTLDPAELAGLVIPGGWAPDKLRRSAAVRSLVVELHRLERPIGIICHGGLVAISAEIVSGRRATGSLGIKDDLVNAGATWVDVPAFRDGHLVWGRVVADIPAFCRELVALLRERAAPGRESRRAP